MSKSVIVSTLTITMFVLALNVGVSQGSSWAESDVFTSAVEFGQVTIENGPDVVSKSLSFKAIPPKKDSRVVLVLLKSYALYGCLGRAFPGRYCSQRRNV